MRIPHSCLEIRIPDVGDIRKILELGAEDALEYNSRIHLRAPYRTMGPILVQIRSRGPCFAATWALHVRTSVGCASDCCAPSAQRASYRAKANKQEHRGVEANSLALTHFDRVWCRCSERSHDETSRMESSMSTRSGTIPLGRRRCISCLAIIAYVFSGLSITLVNKMVVRDSGLHAPALVSSTGALFTAAFTRILVWMGRIQVKPVGGKSWEFAFCRALPVGVLAAGSLCFGNMSYIFLDPGFVQMLKADHRPSERPQSYSDHLPDRPTPTTDHVTSTDGPTARQPACIDAAMAP